MFRFCSPLCVPMSMRSVYAFRSLLVFRSVYAYSSRHSDFMVRPFLAYAFRSLFVRLVFALRFSVRLRVPFSFRNYVRSCVLCFICSACPFGQCVALIRSFYWSRFRVTFLRSVLVLSTSVLFMCSIFRDRLLHSVYSRVVIVQNVLSC